jgi:ribosome-associated protein
MATKKKTPAKGRGVAKGGAGGAAKRPSARKGPARPKALGGRPKAMGARPGGPRGGGRAPNPDRKLPRKQGPRRKTPRSIGREAAPPAARPVSPAPDDSRPLAMLLAKAALDKKAEDVTVYDVRGLSSYADYLVIMTSESDRQSAAVADHVDDVLEKAGHNKVAVEGYETGTWIIVDYGDVVAHVMARATREFYDLDGLWADAPRFTVED